MILFSAEAILASNTSNFGIWIPLVDDEDIKSSTESTISTSLIQCMASVGNCQQVHTSILNLIFQQVSVAGVGNFSKWRTEICSRCWSAPYFFEEFPHWRWLNFWPTVQTGISDLELVFVSLSSPLSMSESAVRYGNSMDSIPADEVLKVTHLDLQKNVSRYTMCVPIAWWPFSAARHSYRKAWHSFKNWMRREWHWSTGNVRISTANWFTFLKIFWIIDTINFILHNPVYLANKFQNSVLVLDKSSFCNSVEGGTLKLLKFFHFMETFIVSFT